MNIDDMGKGILAIIVRLIGMCLLLGGLYIAFQVMLEAFELYRQPEKIQRFATAIEKGSNIDSSLSSFRDTIGTAPEADETGSMPDFREKAASPTPSPDHHIRVSYFLAWVIVLMLLMLIASISLRAIKTGGELVLYDMQIKQFAKMLVKESSKAR